MTDAELDDYMQELNNKCNSLIEKFESQMYETVMGHWNDKNSFLANLSSRWWKGFIAYEAMYLLTLELARKHNDRAATKNKTGSSYGIKYFAVMNIHARACQIFMEILCLLREGFTDGAFARWRSLFELSVCVMFINRYSDNVATAYIEQADTDEKDARWAKGASCFQHLKSNSKVTFKMLFDNCDFPVETKDVWNKQYKLACEIVHASPQGTMKRMGLAGSIDSMLVGGTDWGLHVPAEHAAITLLHISSELLSEPKSTEGMLAIKLLSRWVDIICKYLYEIVGTCFPEVENAAEMYNRYLEKL